MSGCLQKLLLPGEVALHQSHASAVGSNPLSGIEIMVTRQRLLVREGLISRRIDTRMVRDIVAIEVSQGLFGRLFDLGNVRISFGRPNMTPLDLRDIARPRELQRTLLNLLR